MNKLAWIALTLALLGTGCHRQSGIIGTIPEDYAPSRRPVTCFTDYYRGTSTTMCY